MLNRKTPRAQCTCQGECGRHQGPCSAQEGQLYLGRGLSRAERRRFGRGATQITLTTNLTGTPLCQLCAEPQITLPLN